MDLSVNNVTSIDRYRSVFTKIAKRSNYGCMCRFQQQDYDAQTIEADILYAA